jgi:glycine/D-amino acid oxidase-like deaminating enzyme
MDGITVLGIDYAGIIWADGYRGAQNSVQKNLPLAPLKGEILRVEAAPAPVLAGGVLNRAAYLAPRPDGTLWVGSTYEHHYTTPHPTPEGAASILERVGKFFTPHLTIIEHLAGIRPSVLDRRPIIGLLAEHAHQYVYTGMGIKLLSR